MGMPPSSVVREREQMVSSRPRRRELLRPTSTEPEGAGTPTDEARDLPMSTVEDANAIFPILRSG